jgi:drug/metabolite transporter (DMT)-like permease
LLSTPVLSGLFVFIWATGFIIAGIVASHAEPLTFLAMRHAGSILFFTLLTVAAGAAWPRSARAWRDALIGGVLLNGIYLAGVFWAVSRGLGAGLTALVTGLQPLLTAALAIPLLHERLVGRQWVGIAVGVAGIALIVSPKLGGVDAVPLAALGIALLATLSLTLGTIWQKHTKPEMDLRANAAIQFMGALLLTLPLAMLTERGHFDRTPALWGALGWAVIVLSGGSISILLTLLKRGAASKVAPLLYLAPPVAAVMALLLFAEPITLVQAAGMVLAVAGAFAARR